MLSLLAAASLCFAQDEARPSDTITLQIYDVRDLVGLPLVTPLPERDRSGTTEEPSQVERASELLTEFLKSLVGDETTDLKNLNGAIVTRIPEEAHKNLAAVLTLLRQQQSLIQVEIKTYLGNAELCDPILTAMGADLPATDAVGYTALALDAATQTALSLALTKLDCQALNSPRLLSRAMESWMVSTLNQISYISDWSKVVVQGQTILDPEVRVIQEGLVLEGTAVGLRAEQGKGQCIGLSLSFSDHRIQRPIPIRQTELGEIHTPESSVDRFSFTTILDGRSTVLLVCPRLPTRSAEPGEKLVEERIILFISPRILELAPEDEVQDAEARVQRLIKGQTDKQVGDKGAEGGTH